MSGKWWWRSPGASTVWMSKRLKGWYRCLDVKSFLAERWFRARLCAGSLVWVTSGTETYALQLRRNSSAGSCLWASPRGKIQQALTLYCVEDWWKTRGHSKWIHFGKCEVNLVAWILFAAIRKLRLIFFLHFIASKCCVCFNKLVSIKESL